MNFCNDFALYSKASFNPAWCDLFEKRHKNLAFWREAKWLKFERAGRGVNFKGVNFWRIVKSCATNFAPNTQGTH